MNIVRLIKSLPALAGFFFLLAAGSGCGGADVLDQADPANPFRYAYGGGDIILGDPMAPGGGPGFIITEVTVTNDPNPRRTTAHIEGSGQYFTAQVTGTAQFRGTITHDGVLRMTATTGDQTFLIKNTDGGRLAWVKNAQNVPAEYSQWWKLVHPNSPPPPGGPSEWVAGDVVVTEGATVYPNAHIELW